MISKKILSPLNVSINIPKSIWIYKSNFWANFLYIFFLSTFWVFFLLLPFDHEFVSYKSHKTFSCSWKNTAMIRIIIVVCSSSSVCNLFAIAQRSGEREMRKMGRKKEEKKIITVKIIRSWCVSEFETTSNEEDFLSVWWWDAEQVFLH